MPGAGDAVVDFPWGRKHVLTYALTSSEAEDVNLFDRDRRLQICSYSSSGRPTPYSEDDDRPLDVLEHDITARLEPDNFEAWLDLGICYAQKGFYAEAEKAYDRARGLNGEDPLLPYDFGALYAL